MAIGVVFSCDEEKQTNKSRFGKKLTTGGSNLRARTLVYVWPILATVVVPPTPHIGGLLTILGCLKPSEHRDDFGINGRLRQQASCLPI